MIRLRTSSPVSATVRVVNARMPVSPVLRSGNRLAGRSWAAALLACFLLTGGIPGQAAPRVSTESPNGFFTNVASRLLQSELGVSLNRIQLYPTNQYTPSVHRLLQVTANLCSVLPNRTITGYSFLPSVFRPLFTNDGGAVFIAGYAEEPGTNILGASMRDISDPLGRAALQPGDMVYGVPVIVGAKKGFPNFNELAMQTRVYVSRLLEFRRKKTTNPNTDPSNIVSETNQMYTIGISNVFSVEGWNSYSNAYPRSLELIAVADLTASLTNELGMVLVTNRRSAGAVLTLPAETWPGWINPSQPQLSFVLPLDPSTNSFMFLPNATYRENPPHFEVLSHVFQLNSGFPVPRWWLSLNTRLRYVLVDTDANRIVDYVNLDASSSSLDITAKLMEGKDCTIDPSGDYDTNPGSQWCTNRLDDSASTAVPSYGVLNQILVGLEGAYNWPKNFTLDATVGRNAEHAVDSFRFNLKSLLPKYLSDYGKTFYKSNVFYAPLDPSRPIYVHTTWQANDPLVHYNLSDLVSLARTNDNSANFGSSDLGAIGFINPRYEPWNGNPAGSSSSPTITDPKVKDPVLLSITHPFGRSDDWDFPTNLTQALGRVGGVHRGTPWQTIYLKSAIADVGKWQQWVGAADPDEAQRLHPTNDWRLASLLLSLLSTNDRRSLASVNQPPGPSAWTPILDGIEVLTDIAPGQFDTVIMSSNSPQAGTISSAIENLRANLPGQRFREPAELLATPELSFASPWLNNSSQGNPDITDEAYEKIPSQLLLRLRPDSVASISQTGGVLQIQFSGSDAFAYAVEVSSNLVD